MEGIFSVFRETVSEKIIEKSRFITYSSHVESDEEAKSFLNGVCAKHKDATHVCYGYIADKTGNLQRFSDNGEPQGTAGMPILEVIKNKKLFETAVAVVRYFGGIKLGAGGLVRAYSSCASENLSQAKIKRWQTCSELLVTVAYPEVSALLQFFGKNDCEQLASDYADKVTFTLAVKKEKEESFTRALIDTMQGRANIKKTREYFSAFDC